MVNARRKGKKPKPKPAKGIKTGLTKRPPRPTTGYNLFVRDFVQRNLWDANAFRNAAAAWRNLSDAEKNAFNKRNRTEKKKRTTAIKRWVAQERATRRPPSAYSLFVQHLWKTEKATMQALSFQESSRHTAERWAELDAAARRNYHDMYRGLMGRYKKEAEKVDKGGKLNLNWMQGPTAAVQEVDDVDEMEDEDGQDEEEEAIIAGDNEPDAAVIGEGGQLEEQLGEDDIHGEELEDEEELLEELEDEELLEELEDEEGLLEE